MADANHKPRRKRVQSVHHLPAILEEAPANGGSHALGRHLAFPWMQITDSLLAHAGFLPGQHVLFSVDYRLHRITISPDWHYMIGGVPIIQQRNNTSAD